MKNFNYSEPTNKEIQDFVDHAIKVFDDLNDIKFDDNGWDIFMYHKYNNDDKVIYHFCSLKYLNHGDTFTNAKILKIIKIEDLMPHLKKYLLLT